MTLHSRKNEVGGAERQAQRERNTGWRVESTVSKRHWMQSASGVCRSGIFKRRVWRKRTVRNGILVTAKAPMAEVDLKPWMKVINGKLFG